MTGRGVSGPKPDPARRTVEAMAAYGIDERQIALAHNMPLAKLRDSYSRELAAGRVKADASVVEALFKQAVGGNVAAASFWCKARLGWHERDDHRNGAHAEASSTQAEVEISPRELARRIALILTQAVKT